MSDNSIRWKIAGPAGYGIKVTGGLISQTLLRHGLQVFDYTEYPSLIRGGHNTYHVHASERQTRATREQTDILVALDQDSLDWHHRIVSDGGAIVFNGDTVKTDGRKIRDDIRLIPMPLAAIAREVGGDDVMRNTVAAGASVALMDADIEVLTTLLTEQFEKKGGNVAKKNVDAARAGYAYAKENVTEPFMYTIRRVTNAPKRYAFTGNEAVGLGAIKAGCKLYCAYPMTPASSVLHFLAEHADAYDIAVKHAEDEISVINMAIGGGFAGVRSMIGTSGGGFALMTEGLGLAGITETPIVILIAMRPGPATGLPTWTGQGDLRFALHAAQGEFPRIVVAPGDLDECYTETYRAFNLAEKYQTPVIVLSDKHLAESRLTTDGFEQLDLPPIDRGRIAGKNDLHKGQRFARYAFTRSGISPRTIPGTDGGVFLANSDEHDEYGFSEEGSANAIKMMEKRFRKMQGIENDIPQPELHGPEEADVTFIGWGSTKGSVLDAMELLNTKGITANYLHVLYLSPFPSDAVAATLADAKRSIVLEGNYTGQLAGLIRQYTGVKPSATLRKADGRPFWPEAVVRKVTTILA